MGDGASIKKKRFDGTEVEILGETYEPGMPEQQARHTWQQGLGDDRAELIKFNKTGLRYWYAEEGFGSEKRKTPA